MQWRARLEYWEPCITRLYLAVYSLLSGSFGNQNCGIFSEAESFKIFERRRQRDELNESVQRVRMILSCLEAKVGGAELGLATCKPWCMQWIHPDNNSMKDPITLFCSARTAGTCASCEKAPHLLSNCFGDGDNNDVRKTLVSVLSRKLWCVNAWLKDRLARKGNVEGISNFLYVRKDSDNNTNFELNMDMTVNGIECKDELGGDRRSSYIEELYIRIIVVAWRGWRCWKAWMGLKTQGRVCDTLPYWAFQLPHYKQSRHLQITMDFVIVPSESPGPPPGLTAVQTSG